MNEHNEVKNSGRQQGFIIGCIVASLIWWVVL